MTQTEIRQVLDVTKIEQWQPLVTKLKFPFPVSKIPPIPFCTVDRRSRNKFRRGVKSTKFAIAGAKRKKRNFIEICHTQVEITASKFPMAAIRNSGQPQIVVQYSVVRFSARGDLRTPHDSRLCSGQGLGVTLLLAGRD